MKGAVLETDHSQDTESFYVRERRRFYRMGASGGLLPAILGLLILANECQ